MKQARMFVVVLGALCWIQVQAASESPPSIVAQPQGQVLAVGRHLRVSVTATGSNLKYQWYLNGEAIDGAQQSQYNKNDAQVTDGGEFTVNVYNDLGALLSEPAQVVVSSPSSVVFSEKFDKRQVVTAGSGTASGNNSKAKVEKDAPEFLAKKGGKPVWFSWTAPADGVYVFSTLGSSFDTLIAVYLGDSLKDLKLKQKDDELAGYHQSEVIFNAKAGKSYEIAVDGRAGACGDFVLTWGLTSSADPTATIPEPIGGPDDVTANQGQTVTLSVSYTSSEPIEIQWFYEDQPVAGATAASLVLPNLDVGLVGHYRARLRTSAYERFTQPAEVQINTAGLTAVGARNRRIDAIEVGLYVSGATPQTVNKVGRRQVSKMGLVRRHVEGPSSGYTGTQIFNTWPGKDPDEPNHCGILGGASYWFVYQPVETGTVTMTTDGSSFDTILAVYIDDGLGNGYDSLQPVACNDNGGLDNLDSRVVFSGTANTVYYIVVDGKNGAYGTAYLNYNLLGPANHAPVAYPDSGTRIGSQTLVFYVPTLLRNDKDVDGDPLSMAAVASRSANGGTVTRSGNYIYYTPPSTTGNDTFKYLVGDGRGGTDTGTVTIYDNTM
jgi:hypothetical protein